MTRPPVVLLHIDWTACDGRGLCTEILPDLLGRDEWGYPLALATPGASGANRFGSDVPVPPTRIAGAEEAVALCPMLALSLIRRP